MFLKDNINMATDLDSNVCLSCCWLADRFVRVVWAQQVDDSAVADPHTHAHTRARAHTCTCTGPRLSTVPVSGQRLKHMQARTLRSGHDRPAFTVSGLMRINFVPIIHFKRYGVTPVGRSDS